MKIIGPVIVLKIWILIQKAVQNISFFKKESHQRLRSQQLEFYLILNLFLPEILDLFQGPPFRLGNEFTDEPQ